MWIPPLWRAGYWEAAWWYGPPLEQAVPDHLLPVIPRAVRVRSGGLAMGATLAQAAGSTVAVLDMATVIRSTGGQATGAVHARAGGHLRDQHAVRVAARAERELLFEL